MLYESDVDKALGALLVPFGVALTPEIKRTIGWQQQILAHCQTDTEPAVLAAMMAGVILPDADPFADTQCAIECLERIAQELELDEVWVEHIANCLGVPYLTPTHRLIKRLGS